MQRNLFTRFIALLLAFILSAGAAAFADDAAAPTPAPTVDTTVYKELMNGSQDAEDEMHVYYLQVHLKLHGYLAIDPDGVFGDTTEEALRAFQAANDLPVTGVADYYTQALLYSGSDDIVPAPTPEPTARISGTEGDDIASVQTRLITWGFLNGAADGIFGKATEAAVREFKIYLHNQGLDHVYMDVDATAAPTATPTPAPTPELAAGEMPVVQDVPLSSVPTPEPYSPSGAISDSLYAYILGDSFDVLQDDVQSGDNGSEALRVQTRLASLGYLYAGIDGAFGENSARALRFFQYRNGLEETGVADIATQTALFSEDAVPSTEYVFKYKLVVDVSDQRVYAYKWTGRDYGELVRTMICSTGTRANPTLIGTFQSYGALSGEWYYFKKFDCYAKWAFGIVGGYLFHSVIYSEKSDSTLQRGTVSNLGRRASHGCVRLKVEDAKWIYDSCAYGTTVVVRE